MAETLDKLESEVELLEGTIRDLTESIERLEEQRSKLSVEISAKKDRLIKWTMKLKQLREELEEPFGPSQTKTRRRKGENLRAVLDLLLVKDGLSVSEVADKLGIAWSSARRTLEKNPMFVLRDGFWFLRDPVKKANGDGIESLP
jgi:predicted RNase H-like nuclease (RuvC/YqgF family)